MSKYIIRTARGEQLAEGGIIEDVLEKARGMGRPCLVVRAADQIVLASVGVQLRRGNKYSEEDQEERDDADG